MYLNNELIKSELVESQSGRQHVLTADKLLKFDVTPLASESTVKLLRISLIPIGHFTVNRSPEQRSSGSFLLLP